MTNKVIKSITPKAGGGVILAFDFSSLEVMVFTNLAHETELGKIVQAGLDMHSAVAQKIFPELKDVPLKEIKSNYKKLRQYAKSATFGTLYGSSAFNLSQQLDIPTEQAQTIIDSLMKEFPGLQQYCDDCHSFAKTHGYIDTPFGYRRQLDQILLKFKDIETAKAMDKSNKYSKTNPHETNYGLRYKHALNASQNHVVQSTASICGWICASHIQEELIKLNKDSLIEEEKKCLTAYRPKYEVAYILSCDVNKYSFIQIDTNFYSVPDYLVDKRVLVKKYPNNIDVYFKQEIVASHNLIIGKKKTCIDIKHYLDTFTRKPGALRNSAALKASKCVCFFYII